MSNIELMLFHLDCGFLEAQGWQENFDDSFKVS